MVGHAVMSTNPFQHLHGPWIWRATTVSDRWLVVISALLILLLAWYLSGRPPGRWAIILHENIPILKLSLARNQQTQVEGQLGPVTVQVKDGQIRLLEYKSPRMIGTRSGWVSTSGSVLACVPCRILIRVEGEPTAPPGKDRYDGVAR